MGQATFLVDMILSPIYGTNIVLAIQWMRQLGPIMLDYNQLWMQFSYMGQQIQLNGLDRSQYDATRPTFLQKSGTNTG